MLASPVGESRSTCRGMGGRTGDTSVHACIIVILIIVAVLQLVFDPDDTLPTTRPSPRRRIGLSGSGRGRPPIPIMQSQACDDHLPPRSASHATALTDADRMMAAGISLSPFSRRTTD